MKSRILLIGQILVIIIFLGYFAYREYTSPWVFSFLSKKEEPTTETTSVNEFNTIVGPVESPIDLQENLNDSLTKAYALLSTNLEAKLQNRIIYLQKVNASQQMSFEETEKAVSVSVDNLKANTQKSLTDLSSSLRSIEEIEAQMEAAKEDLDTAQENLFKMSSSITELQSFTQELMDERNYEFQTYSVGFNESLTDIVASLQNKYEIPQTDLRELIIRFNDVETKNVSTGNRRPDIRIVTNEELRVPLPKSTGTLLSEQEVPQQLESQLATIKRAQNRYATIQKNLKLQVRKLQSIDISIKAMENLAEGIDQVFENVDFASDTWIDDQQELSPEQKEAWQAFDSAVQSFNFADTAETKYASRAALEKATQMLITAYAETEIATQEQEDPLLWYNSFIKRYFEKE